MNAVTEQEVKATTKVKATGDLIFDISHEVEGLSKTKALNLADKLGEDIETNFFKLGGVLKLIKLEQWFEGYSSFDAYVTEKFGFSARKADYLIDIYTWLVDKQIPWEKVSKVGWTKLKGLAKHLTQDNVDQWVTKAEAMTVLELIAAIKLAFPDESAGKDGNTATSSNVQKLGPFKLHPDQYEMVQTALAKAKGELGSDHDNVAIAGICTGYLSNATGMGSAQETLNSLMAKIGAASTVAMISAQFPQVKLVLAEGTKLPAPGFDISSMELENVFKAFEEVFPNVDVDVQVKEAA